MALDAAARRRWLGAIALGVALAMLLGGQTLLKEKLQGLAFIGYWLLCFGFTCLAILVALLDVRAVQQRTTREHRNLFEATLKDIQSSVRTTPPPQDRRRGGA
jgi:membrane protein implicated in regulation of membrane protease activity